MYIYMYLDKVNDKDLLQVWNEYGGYRRAREFMLLCCDLSLRHSKEIPFDCFTKGRNEKKINLFKRRILIDVIKDKNVAEFCNSITNGSKYVHFVARVRHGLQLYNAGEIVDSDISKGEVGERYKGPELEDAVKDYVTGKNSNKDADDGDNISSDDKPSDHEEFDDDLSPDSQLILDMESLTNSLDDILQTYGED